MKELTAFDLTKIIEMLPLLIPIVLLEWALLITALVHLIKNKRVKTLSFPAWLVIILLVNIIGPILYFVIGKADD